MLGQLFKLGKSLVLVSCFVFVCFVQAHAYEWEGTDDRFEVAPNLTVGGSLRVRYEYADDFKFSDSIAGNDDARTLTQFRLNAKWDPSDWFSLFIEGQDAQVVGENATTNENAVPSPGFVSDPWDLHQGYVDLKGNEDSIFTNIRIGRQKLNFGSERLIGALEWVNTARVWDAVNVSFGEAKKRTIDVFAAQQVTVDPNNPNDWADVGARYQDSDLYGVYFTDWNLIENVQTELYWLFRDNNDTASAGSATSGGDEVHSIGTRFETKEGAWDLNGEFVGQFGDFNGLDHKAFATHIEGGFRIEDLNNSRLGLAYNFATGDSDSSDGDHSTFDNLYPTNHKFYGYMDFVAWQNMHNVEASFQTKLFDDKVPVALSTHWFWLDKEDSDSLYGAARGAIKTASSGSDVSSFVGTEVDLTAKYWIVEKRVNLLVGYSHFFAGDYLDDIGSNEDADFFYVQTKLTF